MAYVKYPHDFGNFAHTAELDSIIRSTLETVQKGKKTTAKVRNSLPAAGFDLSDPGMLATLVTVLVSKHGGVRLSIEDFMLSDDAYVTVYVDPNSQEIVLSLNPNLGKEDIYSMASFVKSDDNTFH